MFVLDKSGGRGGCYIEKVGSTSESRPLMAAMAVMSGLLSRTAEQEQPWLCHSPSSMVWGVWEGVVEGGQNGDAWLRFHTAIGDPAQSRQPAAF